VSDETRITPPDGPAPDGVQTDARHGPEPAARSRRPPGMPRPATAPELLLYRVCRVFAVGLSRLYFPGRVVGRGNLPSSGAYLLAPVHRSYVDWLIVARVTKRRLRYIVKAEVWKFKLVGRLIEALGAFPVNRSGADREALERCLSVLSGGEPLVMFPEGTRRSGPLVEDLREGVAYLALRAGVPVVPVGIGGSESAMPRGSKLPKPRRVEIVIGPPVPPPAAPTSAPPDGDDRTGRSTRVSRRAMHDFSAVIGAAVQQAFDEASSLAAPEASRSR
jgi:1-acyl-sn-glycerol-3-phosphate acyltransferase